MVAVLFFLLLSVAIELLYKVALYEVDDVNSLQDDPRT